MRRLTFRIRKAVIKDYRLKKVLLTALKSSILFSSDMRSFVLFLSVKSIVLFCYLKVKQYGLAVTEQAGMSVPLTFEMQRRVRRDMHIQKTGFISFTSISSTGQSSRERDRESREIRGGESMTE